ncbi:ATP-binding protein [Lacimicrobium sp. SS2-24]|uniref:sensor histidine kinase n=1 Tax=Lacimicrobium sp. SS2-24 TaxID=2005569 RepID=UPI00143BEC53|nr:ATP-binding protein [Lacimicrobium sp. SS2-24]
MNIKTRILVFVILFEVLAYSTLQIFNTLIYKQALDEFKQGEIRAVFNTTISKINSLTQSMEQSVIDLAINGEALYQLRHTNHLSTDAISALAQSTLIKKFSSFRQAMGGGLWYQPYVIDNQTRYFGPYVFRDEQDNITFTWDLNTPEYDYLNQDWYRLAVDNDWGRKQPDFRATFWTEPYRDGAGSFSLMMTVDAVMVDSRQEPIGLATVDWSLAQITRFLDSIRVTENAIPFLFHRASGLILSYPADVSLVMESTTQLPWAAPLIQRPHQAGINQISALQHSDNLVFYQTTEQGFVFGSLVPQSDLRRAVDEVSRLTLLTGSAIGLGFILLMIFILRALFSPFDQVLSTIKRSISYGKNKQVMLNQVEYDKKNEFTPIITALNDVYHQVKTYVSEIEQTNAQLMASQQEVRQLNAMLEKKVALRTAELETKTKEVTDSLERLRRTQQQLVENEKHASLGRLVAGVAHQINTPLGICVTAASMLENIAKTVHDKAVTGKMSKNEFNQAHEKIMQSAELLSENLQRATNLITSFKQVAVDNDKQQNRWFNLCEYIDSILLSLRSRIEQTPHRIECQYEQEIRLFASPGALAQILSQLVENALTYAFDDTRPGTITIGVSQQHETLNIKVSDDGCGMPEAVRKQVFDPFFSTSKEQLGNGLGLHIVYNLVIQKLGGDIRCDSEPGSGTTFTISIPLSKESEPESQHQ